jgi:Raf kinase inhibitor-like YbhB/YbcL family protein
MRHVPFRFFWERCLQMKIPQHAILHAPLAVLLLSTSISAQRPAKTSLPSVSAQPSRNVTTFTLTSTDLKNGAFAGGQILNTFGCSGDNVSPQLSWTNAPAGTKSFVLTMFDPDAPTGSGFWHWVVVNIPASTTALPNGASKDAAKLPVGSLETRTDLGAPGYGGPCPPARDKPHRYIFTLHALKVEKLDLDVQTSAALVGFNVHMEEIGRATLTARYGR